VSKALCIEILRRNSHLGWPTLATWHTYKYYEHCHFSSGFNSGGGQQACHLMPLECWVPKGALEVTWVNCRLGQATYESLI
jgi:hypothetical protein